MAKKKTSPRPAAASSDETNGVDLPIPLSRIREVPDAEFDVQGIAPGLSLLSYQKVGAGAMTLVPRMVLGDQVGLGKTIQKLSSVRKLMEMGRVTRSIGIVPQTLLYQWANEAEKWYPGWFKTMVVVGDRGQRHRMYERIARSDNTLGGQFNLVLLSYSTLRVDKDIITKLSYDDVFFDEASNLRNPATDMYKASLQLVETIGRKRVQALTATPVQSRLEDYHAIMGIVDPAVLGTKSQFLNEFCNVRVDLIEARNTRKIVAIKTITGYKNLEQFKERMSNHVLQRTAEDVSAQLPDLVIVDKWLQLTPAQDKRYAEIEDGLLDVAGYEDQRQEAIQRLTRLSQVCDATQLVYPERSSSKIDEIKDLLQHELHGESVVIFSKYVTMLDAIRKEVLDPLGISYGTVYGGQDPAYTEQQRLAFQAGKLQVMLMSTAGEMGLNLGAAKYLICCDLLYNEGRMRQLYGRIRRLSSVHATATILRLLCRNTLEERILSLLEKRAALIDFLDDPEKMEVADLQQVMRLINRRVNLLE